MRALVTGAGGFAGQWLCAELLREGWDVHGAELSGGPSRATLARLERAAVSWHRADLRDEAATSALIDAARPDAVFHLAAVSHLPAAGADPRASWATNVGAATALLGIVAARRAAGMLDPVVVVAGSCEQYGSHPASDLPLAEGAEQRPASVYAETKVAQEAAALACWHETGTRVVAARAFNHSGPGQAPTFLLPSLVRRAHEAFEGGLATIRIGNPSVVRDFLHVKDVVRAYVALALHGEPGEAYNICTGIGTSVAELAALVLESAAAVASTGKSTDASRPVPRVHAVPDPALMRPVDVPVLIGSHAKLTARTGWKPAHTLKMVIDDLTHYQENDETD